jgi:hypothetical protein
VFAQLKEMLSTAPLFQRFDPTLSTEVHVNTRQHTVGDVLLQWDKGEQVPQPVSFFLANSRVPSGITMIAMTRCWQRSWR